MDARPLPNTLRKRKSREIESSDKRVLRQKTDSSNKRVKRAAETVEQREERLKKNRERTHLTRSKKRAGRTQYRNVDGRLPEADLKLLNDFLSKIDRISNNLCPVCNECFPSIEFVQGECRRCHSEKGELKKFSRRNNMDPGEVPDELQGLTQIEEMLIAQIFPIVSVYCLRGGQYAYRGNVINFPQDVLEFATHLPRHPSSLDVLVVRRRSSSGKAFKDFNVRRSVVSRALIWLKNNNRYYSNIVINEDVLRSLPENGPLDDQILRLEDERDEILVNSEDLDDSLVSNFVSVPFSVPNEEVAIADTIARMRSDVTSIMWLNIGGIPVNSSKHLVTLLVPFLHCI